jgi:two-component system NtrC family sensor kinase
MFYFAAGPHRARPIFTFFASPRLPSTPSTILAFLPFAVFYAIPFLLGKLPSGGMKISVLSLGILPLTFGYAIVRYRLMDVDLIFKRGMVYTLAAAAIAGVYFTVVGLIALLVHARVPSSGSIGLVLAIVVTALLIEPVRKWIQGRMDRLFYRQRYDYRHTLIEFGRELNAETDLENADRSRGPAFPHAAG